MKIVNIILTSQNGGAEQVFIDYCKILKNYLGHQVLAITKFDAPYAEKLEELNIDIKKIKNNFGYNDFFAVKNIRKILEDFDADAVISHAGRATILARKAIKKIKHKKIFEIAVNHSNNVKRSIGADLIISVNKQIFYKTIDSGQSTQKSFVIYNAIKLKEIDKNFQKINFRDKQTIVIGILGRLERTKGFSEAIKAMKILQKKSDKKFILKIGGSGKEEANLRALVNNLDMQDSVEFLGWVKNKEDFFNSIDIFILPSLEETFGLVILEAMKFKRPIITSDADGPKEILRDNNEALFFAINPVKNIEERIAASIIKLINDDELANKIVKNAFTKLEEKFSFESLVLRLKEIVGN